MDKSGIIVLNKPEGMSSFLAVKLVQRATSSKKAGHMGTLDPLAEGVLLIGVNKGTKLFDKFLNSTKIYRTKIKFGQETDTLDREGEVINSCEKVVTESELKKVLSNFVGKYPQMPPKYSAKKINGKKACDLARKGVEVELKPKQIEVFDLKLVKNHGENVFEFEIFCSSGFYVRSFARDIAKAVDSCGYCLTIQRTKCGDFSLSDAQTLEEIKAGNAKIYDVCKEGV